VIILKRPRFLLIIFLAFFTGNVFSQNLDIRILRNLNSAAALPSDGFFRFVSNSDAVISLGVPAAIFAAGLIKHDDALKRSGFFTIAAVGISSGITLALKYTINRDRPFVTYPDITKKSKGGSPSFPSGHTCSAFTLATSLSLNYPKWYIIAPSFIWAGTVGFSRMDLGVHYPSDVIAGALVGAGSAWLTHIVNKKLIQAYHRKR
jgi:membrane-associated phospholipid phosphatase